MAYGAILSARPFLNLQSSEYIRQIQLNREHHTPLDHSVDPYVPLPSERTPIAFSFMLCISVGVAVLCLLAFHIYLLLTGQTTIEFHGNCSNWRQARRLKKKHKTPYDLGMKRNFQQVYGCSRHPILAVMVPSWREPEFLPLPLPGEEGKRRTTAMKKTEQKENDETAAFLV